MTFVQVGVCPCPYVEQWQYEDVFTPDKGMKSGGLYNSGDNI